MARKKKAPKAPVKATRVFNGDDLRDTVAKIEAAMDKVNEAQAALKSVRKTARAKGYSLKILGGVIAEHRAKKPQAIEEERAIGELYRQALGLTPMEEIMLAADDDDAPQAPAENGAGAALQ